MQNRGMTRQRLDQVLVERGLSESREKAQRLILAGQVTVNGAVADKPGRPCPADAAIAIAEPERYVSRGGLKLEHALDHFQLDVRGRTCVDVGSSTGGFTDCLLQRGAARVYAVDVGKGQLHWRLRTDPRVVVMEEVNARHLSPDRFPEALHVATADVSFISLTLVLPAVITILQPGALAVTLIKPQFEAGREQVGRGGVVRDPAVHAAVIDRVRLFGTGTLGLTWRGVTESPIRGPAGNIEFLACWEKP